MKRFIVALFVLAFASTVVMANGQIAVEAKDITLKGKLTKIEKKDGEKVVVSYVLESGDQKVALPAKVEAVKLDELVGQEVEMVVKGTEKDKKVTVTEVVSAKKVEAPKAEAKPAVEAAPATK